MFSQKPEQIRSVASDGLIKYLEATVSLNIKKKTVQISRKTGFKVEIEDQNQRQSWLQLVGTYGMDNLKMGKFFTFIFNLTLKVKANHPTIQQGS